MADARTNCKLKAAEARKHSRLHGTSDVDQAQARAQAQAQAHPPSHPPTHIHKTVCSPELVPGCDLETSTRLCNKELFCAVILSNAKRISRGRISDRRSPSPIPPATRASIPEARRHRFCPGRLLHFGPDLVGHCAPPGHLVGTAPFTSNRSALPERRPR